MSHLNLSYNQKEISRLSELENLKLNNLILKMGDKLITLEQIN